MSRYVCIHGHFYQPSRENPWLDKIELQEQAYPYHDWNQKISSDCYAPNSASRILGPNGSIVDIVNNYTKISFDLGPTLLSWLEIYSPEVYKAILDADKEAKGTFSGHGTALAMCYNHMIMPLANSRDKRTQVRWGIRDFRVRFGRKPEGMWLPETAVDIETLDIMAEEGIKFTILNTSQAKRTKVEGEKIDPKVPYLCTLPSGRTIAIFFYDHSISNAVAFDELLKNGESFANRLADAFLADANIPQLVNIATDGESYGHHHRYGEMALSYCLYCLESNGLAQITVYGEYLARHPPTDEVEIIENTSWSCFHGVERWKDDCGCTTGGHPEWNQAWRDPLREAMDWLRDHLISIYEMELSALGPLNSLNPLNPLIKDPWEARNDYIDVICDRSIATVERFLERHAHAAHDLSMDDKIKVLKLLEMQRHAMLMYTSCGWFFEDVSGIETIQIMRHASRAMQLAKEVCGEDLEASYIQKLEKVPSNRPEYKNAANIYDMFVKPSQLDILQVAARYVGSFTFEDEPKPPKTLSLYCYTIDIERYERLKAGKRDLAMGRLRISSGITWEETVVSFAVLHMGEPHMDVGDHKLVGGVRRYTEDKEFELMLREIKDAFVRNDIPTTIHLLNKHFETFKESSSE